MKHANAATKKRKRLSNRTREQRIKSTVIPALRNRSRYWKDKQEARKLAKRKIQIGLTLKGKPKYKTVWECASCGKFCDKGESQMDHINAVVDPSVGWVNYDTFIDRLFAPPEGWQCLCLKCHSDKTEKENKIREKLKNESVKTKK